MAPHLRRGFTRAVIDTLVVTAQHEGRAWAVPTGGVSKPFDFEAYVEAIEHHLETRMTREERRFLERVLTEG